MSETRRGQLTKHLRSHVQEFGFPQAGGELGRLRSDVHFRMFVLTAGGQEAGGGREVRRGWEYVQRVMV